MKNRLSFPPIGMRIIKTAIAVFLSFMIYILRGFNGTVIQSAIAAIVCMQPYNNDSMKSAFNRALSTLMGGLWGLLFLTLCENNTELRNHIALAYFFMAFGVVVVLYSCVLTKTTDAACLAAIVFLCVIVGYPDVESPVIQTFDRIVDTTIGVIVAVVVNSFHLPRKKHHERVFFIHLQDLVEDRFSHASSRVLIELNRLYDDGAKICLETKWAPAFLISQMGLMKINMPIIVMDGTAIYDVNENQFLDVIEISKEVSKHLENIFLENDLGYLVFAIRNNTMLTFCEGEMNEGERKEYEILRRSPYRNYLEGKYHSEDKIFCLRVMVPDEEADNLEKIFEADKIIRYRLRVSRRIQPRIAGYTSFYFMDRFSGISVMEKRIMDHMDEVYPREDSVHKNWIAKLLPKEEKKDWEPINLASIHTGHLQERDSLQLLKELRDIYEPYSVFDQKET